MRCFRQNSPSILRSMLFLCGLLMAAPVCLAQRATFVREVSLGEPGKVTELVFLPDGMLVAAGSKALYDETVRILDPQTGKLVKEIEGEFDSSSIHLAVAPNGVLVAACENGSLNAWKPPYDKPFWSDSPKDWNYSSVAVSPDGKFAATAGWKHNNGGTTPQEVAIWDVQTGQKRVIASDYPEFVTSAAISPDGKTLICSGQGKKTGNDLRGYDMKTGKQTFLIPDLSFNAVDYLTFTPNGKFVAGGHEHAVLVMNANNGKAVAKLERPDDEDEVFLKDIAFSPDGKLLVTGNEQKTLSLWDTNRGKVVQKLEAHRRLITAVAFSPDGRTMVSGGYDGKIRFYKIDPPAGTGKLPKPDAASKPAAKPASKPTLRTWTSADGNFKVKATLKSYSNGVAVLLTTDGRELNVPAKKLSAADQAYLRQ